MKTSKIKHGYIATTVVNGKPVSVKAFSRSLAMQGLYILTKELKNPVSAI